MADDFYRQLGTGVASLTFGVALSVFIYAVASGIVGSLQAWLLFGTSFLLMLRFWWRYNELFVQFLPSKTYWHFLFDFATAFFGILTVLVVGNMQTWALVGALAMLASIIRCSLSRNAAKDTRIKIKRTFFGALGILVFFLIIYLLAFFVDHVLLSAASFVIVLLFVAHSSKKP